MQPNNNSPTNDSPEAPNPSTNSVNGNPMPNTQTEVRAPAAPAVETALSRSALKVLISDKRLDWAFRIGLASVFFINSATALLQPASFLTLLNSNFIAAHIGHFQALLYFIALNDFILGALIILGIKKKYVYAWAGLWLATVTFFKFTFLM